MSTQVQAMRPMSTLVRFLVTLLAALTTLAPLVEAKGKTTSTVTKGKSKLAKGVIIAIVVIVVVGIILCCVAAFCILRCLRTRKSTKGTAVVAPPVAEHKPADVENQNYYNNGGAPGAYGQPQQPAYNQPAYDSNANQYGTHQNEYNAGYNNTGYNAGYNAGNTGYNASNTDYNANNAGAAAGYYNSGPQQHYAPPSGPPSMPVPPSGNY